MLGQHVEQDVDAAGKLTGIVAASKCRKSVCGYGAWAIRDIGRLVVTPRWQPPQGESFLLAVMGGCLRR